jgi:hypothetical protein
VHTFTELQLSPPDSDKTLLAVESFRVDTIGCKNSEWFNNQFSSQPFYNLKVCGESNGRSLKNKGNCETKWLVVISK